MINEWPYLYNRINGLRVCLGVRASVCACAHSWCGACVRGRVCVYLIRKLNFFPLFHCGLLDIDFGMGIANGHCRHQCEVIMAIFCNVFITSCNICVFRERKKRNSDGRLREGGVSNGPQAFSCTSPF